MTDEEYVELRRAKLKGLESEVTGLLSKVGQLVGFLAEHRDDYRARELAKALGPLGEALPHIGSARDSGWIRT
jgi:hypothetical protein